METSKLLVVAGLVAPPLFAALTLWYSGVAVAHAKVAAKCGRWLAIAGAFGVLSVGFITTSFCAIYVAQGHYGWLIGSTPKGLRSAAGILVIIYALAWVAAFWAGTRLIKRRETQQVAGPDASQTLQASEPAPAPSTTVVTQP